MLLEGPRPLARTGSSELSTVQNPPNAYRTPSTAAILPTLPPKSAAYWAYGGEPQMFLPDERTGIKRAGRPADWAKPKLTRPTWSSFPSKPPPSPHAQYKLPSTAHAHGPQIAAERLTVTYDGGEVPAYRLNHPALRIGHFDSTHGARGQQAALARPGDKGRRVGICRC